MVRDLRVATQVTLALRQIDISMDRVDTLADTSELLAAGTYDLIVADLDEAADDAVTLLSGLVPLRDLVTIVCGSRIQFPMIRRLLNSGIDDFVLKPLDPDELRMRISRLTATGTGAGRQALSSRAIVEEVGDLTFDRSTSLVHWKGAPIDLTPRERSVLMILLRHRGTVVSKERLADRIYRGNEEVGPAAIETYVHRLRRKLADTSIEIKTLRGLGYMLYLRNETDRNERDSGTIVEHGG